MIGMLLLSMVCTVGADGADKCDLYERVSWVLPTTGEMRKCVDMAAAMTRDGKPSRCEVVDLDETPAATPHQTSTGYKEAFKRWTF